MVAKKHSILICGAGGAGLHCAQIAEEDGRGQVVGLFDPFVQQLEKAGARFPSAKTGENYKRLLEKTRPDVVVVAGPDHLHADQTVTALESGCHVLNMEIVIIRKNKAVLDAEICPWSKVDGHSLLSNRVEFNLNPN